MNIAPPLSDNLIARNALSIWNHFIRLSNMHNRPMGQKEKNLQQYVSRLFSNDAVGTQIATRLAPILRTPEGRWTGTTSETKAIIEVAIRSVIWTPITPAATTEEYDSHIAVMHIALRNTVLESLESDIAGGVPSTE
ncbi:hypothetical protein BGZ88_001127 [Linnemannia elongata]|nr:hypothetical protein BGZ88_001127 [Linnemannia elongata]